MKTSRIPDPFRRRLITGVIEEAQPFALAGHLAGATASVRIVLFPSMRSLNDLLAPTRQLFPLLATSSQQPQWAVLPPLPEPANEDADPIPERLHEELTCDRINALGLLANAVIKTPDNPVVILLMLNVLLLFIGAVMDNIAAMIILGGVLTTVGQQLGMDPTHLGAMVVINFAIGMATPPFGYSLFVGSAISKETVERISRAMGPLLCVEIVVLLLVTFVPGLTLWLPNWLG